jgi:hypothetical protein
LLDWPELDPAWCLNVLRDYVWLAAQAEPRERTEKCREALRRVDALLQDGGVEPQVLHSFRVERAHLLAALGQTAEAEQALRHYFAPAAQEVVRPWLRDYRATHRQLDRAAIENIVAICFLDACLLHGFLRECAGDTTGAKKIWADGFDEIRATPTGGCYEAAVLGSLSDQITRQDAARMVDSTISSAALLEDPLTKAFAHSFFRSHLTELTTILRRAWQSPEGHDTARAIALRTLSFREYTRAQLKLWIYEGLALAERGAAEGALELDAARRRLLWQLADDLRNEYLAGRMKELTLAQVLLPGQSSLASWMRATESVPHLRGGLAYLMGRHLVVNLGQPAAAQPFFQFASEDPRAGSWAALARQQLAPRGDRCPQG